ncbi:MAG: PKD domain-containing protein [Actinobacteria bacterium]|nr:PKD domain-containing protein [Actinomycetota bacterium]
MGIEILYLDGSKDKAVGRVLKKYGKLSYAGDINDAAELIAEKEFDYCFLDADVPCVRELLTHLEHDPYFVPPRAFVLLTNNEVEDCDAWNVDTYITRRRIKDDIPFVFSHHRGEPADNTGVLKLIPGDSGRPEAGRKVESSDSRDAPGAGVAGREDCDCKTRNPAATRQLGISAFSRFAGAEKAEVKEREDFVETLTGDGSGGTRSGFGGNKPVEEFTSAFSPADYGSAEYPEHNEIPAAGGTLERGDGKRGSAPGAPSRHSRVRLVYAGIVAIALCVLLYAAAPPGIKGTGDKKTNSAGSKAKAFDEDNSGDGNKEGTGDFLFDDIQEVSGSSALSSEPTAGNSEVSQSPVTVAPAEAAPPQSSTPAPSSYSSPAPVPAPSPQPAANNPPSVSISGPAQVYARQTSTYTAVASDPDGDSISYSWGSSSKSMSWSTPGQYTVTVTVTDSRGASRSASISVRVI